MQTAHHSFFAAILLMLGGLLLTPAQAAQFCADDYYVEATLPNQASWDMCWEHRNREGIVLHHIHYTPRNGERRMVLYRAAIAQIHVPYDDNGARYHDVSDYGLGGSYLKNLTAAECQGGELINYAGKNILCQQVSARDDAYSLADDRLQGDALSLFSVSAIGAYNYIPEWRFLDDGSIEPGMGATGALQRFGSASIAQHGWLIADNKTGIAHLHNFFWKLDFDLAGTSNNDIVEEINYNQNNGAMSRTHTRFTREAARRIDPAKLRSWRVLDGDLQNSKGLPLSYEIRLNATNQQDIGPDTEPFTHYDFYVTRQKSCELFASHNPGTYGCATDLTGFANNESIENQDIVVWPAVTFYHMPRAEDAPLMDVHWTHFHIIPRDWHDANPLSDAPETTADDGVTEPPPASGEASNDGSAIRVDGGIGDWANLISFGTDPDDVSGVNNRLDWREAWMANDRERFYLAYRTHEDIATGNWWGYQLYLDTDASTASGYRTAALGADYLIEGANIWRYTGNGGNWSWRYQGSMTWQVTDDVAEFSFPRHWLGDGEEIRLLFWGNNAAFGGDARDAYPDGAFDANADIRHFTYRPYTDDDDGNPVIAISNPVNAPTLDGNLNDWGGLTSFGADPAEMDSNNPLDWQEGWLAHDTDHAYLAYRTRNAIDASGFWGYQVYFDTDSNVTTGYHDAGTGAEYMLEGKELWRYAGSGNNWSWEHQGTVTHGINGQTAEFRIPREWLGAPSALRLRFQGNNQALGGDAKDAYPDSASTPAYFEYSFQ